LPPAHLRLHPARIQRRSVDKASDLVTFGASSWTIRAMVSDPFGLKWVLGAMMLVSRNGVDLKP
jgi:hypothetical protein